MRAGIIVCLLLAGCGLLIEEPPIDRADARFEACGGVGNDVVAAFPMRAADYQSHFPQIGRAPELEVDEPAFAVVFGEDARLPIGGERADEEPGTHFMCVYLGTPPTGTPNWYAGVDIEGMKP